VNKNNGRRDIENQGNWRGTEKDNLSSQRWRKAMKRESTPSPAYAYKAARHWSMRAEEMRALAEEASDPMVRAMMLGLAADYDLFAEIADDRAGGGSIMFRLAEMPPERRPDAQAGDSLVDNQGALAQAG
jgi:hypothetical protein